MNRSLNSSSTDIPKWALPVVLILTAILYSKALQNGLLSFDDDVYISKNPFLKDNSLDGIKAIFTSFYAGNYHPLTTITYLFEYTWYGLEPLPYHLLNVLLHLINTILVFKLTEQLSGKKTTALVVCILFAVHPMHVESVAWVSERKDVLYSMFYLWSLLIYLRYIVSGFKPKFYIGAILLFVLSLFSKSAAVTLPVLMIVIDIYKGRKINKSVLLEKAPFIALSILFGILNLMSQHAVGAIIDLGSKYNYFNRVCIFTSSLSFYIISLFAPFHLSAIHVFPVVNHSALPVLFYVSLLFVAMLIWFLVRNNYYQKETLFGIAFFLVTISVMLQIVPVGYTFVAERYTYIPYIGLFYVAGQWITESKKYRHIVIGVFSLFVALFSVQTWQRINVWENNKTLLSDVLKKDPANSNRMSQGLFQRGEERIANGNAQGAIDDFTDAILLSPKFTNAYFNRGLLYFNAGDFKSAIADYNKAIELDPKSALVYYNRGCAYHQENKLDSAISDYNKAISLDSSYALAYNNRGSAFCNMGNKQAGMNDYNRAISLDPKLAYAYSNRGWAYMEAGNMPLAIIEYEKAVFYDPKNPLAYCNLAGLKAHSGDLKGAIADYDSLIKITPDDNNAYNARANARFQAKDSSGACADWEKASMLGNENARQKMQQFCH